MNYTFRDKSDYLCQINVSYFFFFINEENKKQTVQRGKKKKKTKNGCRLHPLRLLKQKVADAGDECKLHPLKESKPPSDESLVGAR